MDGKKKPLNRAERKKRNQRLMILLVSAIMVLSGLFLGVGNPPKEQEQNDYSDRIIEYQVYPVGNTSVPVNIIGKEDEIVLMFNNVGALNRDVIDIILGEDISGVKWVTFEYSSSYTYFRFQAENLTKAVRGIGNTLRFRDYKLYSVYKGNTSIGVVTVVGGDMKVGDYAKVLLFQRSRESVFDLIGFSQGVVHYGDVVKANLTNVIGVLYDGVLSSSIDVGVLQDIPGVDDVVVVQPRLFIDAMNYSVSLANATVQYRENMTVVEADDFIDLVGELDAGNMTYVIAQGRVSFIVPTETEFNVSGLLEDMGVLNVTDYVVGFSVVPEEITDGNRIIRLPDSHSMFSVLNETITEGVEFRGALAVMVRGNRTFFAVKEI